MRLSNFGKILFVPQNIFRFKQFTVAHDKCAMKVNTDGVLLGAWQDVSEAQNILDIGTGSGVIALMMAQKNKHAIIDAIDIDKGAFDQATQNFKDSVWRDRLSAFHDAVQDFIPGKEYDAIICNPPYFIDDYKNADYKRKIARHSTTLSYETLLLEVNRLLHKEGKALVSLPAFNLSIFESLAKAQNLFVVRVTEVIAASGKEPYLALLQLEKSNKTPVKRTLQIQNSAGEFTREYKELTKDFYLKF